MSYLSYSPATSKYPIRGFGNPNFVESPDAIPPQIITLSYQSNGDTNGLFYYLGTNGLTTGFVNPSPGTVGIVVSSSTYSEESKYRVTDRVLDSNGFAFSQFSGTKSMTFTLPGTIKINRYTRRNRNAIYNATLSTLKGSNDNITFTSIAGSDIDSSSNNGNGVTNVSGIITGQISYRYIQVIVSSNDQYSCVDELEFYGDWTPD